MLNEIKILLIVFCLYSFFYHKSIKIIKLDNEISEFENNFDFSEYTTDIKIVAIYHPSINWTMVKKLRPIYYGHHQPRIPGDQKNYLKYYELTNVNIFKKQIQLAKSHGIYGFAIYYYGIRKRPEKPLYFYLNNKDINFPFLLILKNNNYQIIIDNYKRELKEEYFEEIIKDIKKFLIDPRYIKLNKKPILGISELNEISLLKSIISILRKYSKKYGIGNLFILGFINGMTDKNKTEEFQNIELFNLVLMLPPKDTENEDKVKDQNYSIYSYLLYKNIELNNKITKFYNYRCSILEYNDFFKLNSSLIFNDYSSEQFYIFNKVIIEWTKKNFDITKRFIFINAWNDWNKGNYLEPDEKYGYASINSLSKAIFNLPYTNIHILNDLNERSKIAVQAHIYYEDLINEIIEKINNIPVKFDLFISTDSKFKKDIIEKNIYNYSNILKYEIQIFKNKGRDVLPFIIQIKKCIKKYKYVCHIHTKKSFHCEFGEEWRLYLYNNLLGNIQIVSEILSDFENTEKLGFVFPEIFYKILLNHGNKINDYNLFYMNFLIRKIYPGYGIIEKISEFPAGNMFWARTIAIYQIFEKNIEKKFPKELGQIDSTLMHAIERIWLYIVKLNGYFYKTIFKHF